jgi:poly(3-hydroxybutyrate) depolymerase
MRTVLRILTLVLAVTLSVPPAHPARAGGSPYTVPPVAGTLGTYHVSDVYVAGVSSGGYMATQLHVAYSGRIRGAAVFAAGPYYCAQNNLTQALYGCGDTLYPTHLGTLEAYTRTWAGYGWVDPVGNLAGSPVYVYHGANDGTVEKPVTDDLVRYYRDLGAVVRYDDTAVAGHAWVSPYGPVACADSASPYLNDCGTDPQRDMLATLLGGVRAPNTGPLGGRLVRFGQDAFAVGGWSAAISMDSGGFAYLPASCAAGATCRLLVALHGCRQGYATVGTTFVDRANLDQYADTNDLIVLYPQAVASTANPKGCWDWWGYLGQSAYPVKGGAQVETVMNMVRRLTGR